MLRGGRPIIWSAHNDLHNLFPAVGEVNGDRSNFNWGMVEGNKREYGACPMEVDESIRRAEPPDVVKGNVARVMFYMEVPTALNCLIKTVSYIMYGQKKTRLMIGKLNGINALPL